MKTAKPIVRALVALAVAGGLAGCGAIGKSKLYDERNVTVSADGVNDVIVDAPKAEQTVTVAFTATGSPVNVFVVLDKNATEASKSLISLSGKEPPNTLTCALKQSSGSLEARIPAGEKFHVFLTSAGGKDAEVNVKMTGK